MGFSDRVKYEALPLRSPSPTGPAMMDDPLLRVKNPDIDVEAESIVVQLNAQRRAALAEVDNAPFS